MKRYSDYNHASVSMSADADFRKALQQLFRSETIAYLFESGTFDGSGSTTTLARAVLESGTTTTFFVTAEVDLRLFRKAKKNLAAYPFVQPVWGRTVAFEKARAFIERDEAINQHHRFPDIFIDDVEDPKGFYLNELSGKLSKHHLRRSWTDKLSALFEKKEAFAEDLFQTWLPNMESGKSLILLDSAGGLGYLEFQTVQQLMEGKDYFLILDDIHHLKHFRSYRDLQQDRRYQVLAENRDHGWVLAKRKGSL